MDRMERAKRPFWAARNWSADAGAGSIHDDATATRLGFRGGTVAGSIHMDQCAALLVEEYGKALVRRRRVSLFFRNPPPTASVSRHPAGCPGRRTGAVWVRRDDGLEVAEGTASIGITAPRRCAPATCGRYRRRACASSRPRAGHDARQRGSGRSIPSPSSSATGAALISDPLSWYADASPWGGAIATVSTAVDLLWGTHGRTARRRGDAVGLFGAIEVAFMDGPLLLGETYRVTAEVVALSESPKTESLWFDSVAMLGERPVASQRMMLRFMKASSPLYPELTP
jgi:hypothetical protein